MSTNLATLTEAFAGLEVLVIGDAMLDSYIEGSADRLCQEAPVPVVAVQRRTDAPGGAANVAANAAALGARVQFLGVTGGDEDGALLRGLLAVQGVDCTGLLDSPLRATLAKRRVYANRQLLVRFDEGATDPAPSDLEDLLIVRLEALFPDADAVFISDYGYGTLTPRVLEALAHLQAASPRLLFADVKDYAPYRAMRLAAAKPNYRQAAALLGEREQSEERVRVQHVASSAAHLLEATGAQVLAVTLDAAGALVIEHGAPPYRTYARAMPHARAAGAGDTFLATLGLALATGAQTTAAAELASAAAAVVVARDGTATCSAGDLRAALSVAEPELADRAELARTLARERARGRRIVFTNGCFDILHRGHITYLNRAKALGDVLVVGLNSDASVRRLKGADRPINSLEDRAQVLGAMSCVDHIVAFDEDVPLDLIRALRPDVYVKGGDYTRESLPEAVVVEELGGSVQILAYVEDRSTTGIIERIRSQPAASPPGSRT